jgi:gliding motility-associated-like protein
LKANIRHNLCKLLATTFLWFAVFSAKAQAPTPNFSASPLAGCSPVIVNFTDLSTGNPTAWLWDFGNGNTSTLRNPTATYFTPGTYNVSLRVTNASGTNILVRPAYITVYEPPVVNFSGNSTSGCYPKTVQFTDLSTPGIGNTNVSWQWDFGDGNTSTQQNPVAVYSSSGSFTVTLRVTNDKGCIKTFTRPNYIVINGGVEGAFTHTQPSVCRVPTTINFTNNTTGPGTISYQWNFGDGNNSSATSPSHTYTTAGTYIVTLIATSSLGCTDTVRSNPILIGGFTTDFNISATICPNIPITFTNNSSPAPLSTTWNFGDGNTAAGLNALHTYASPGTYTVWMYNTYSTCLDSVSHIVTVNAPPVADFTAPVTSKCQPSLTVNFQDISSGGVNAWQWDFGDGGTSTQQNPVHTYSNYGSFDVTLIATSTAGCKDTIVKTGFINIRRAQVTVSTFPERGCLPHTINVFPTINALDVITSYEWDFGDGGTSTSPTPSHTYTVQGEYDVRLIITTSSGCRDTIIFTDAVRVGNKPVADFVAQPIPVCGRQPVFFTNLTNPSDQWEWDFGDGGTSNLENPFYSYEDTGWFDVTLIAYNVGCGDTIIKSRYTRVLPPIAKFQAVADCNNRLRFDFIDQSIDPQSWEWDFGDGSPRVMTQNPSHTFPALGIYQVMLIVTNGSCRDSIQIPVHAVDENPDFTADQLAACKTADITFNATTGNASNIVSYDWDFGNGTGTSTTPTITHTYTAAGLYSIRLVTTDINGCTDTAFRSNYIRINGPLANFSATNTNGCSGLVTTFNDLSTTDGTNALVGWYFNFGDGNSQNFTAAPFQHTYTAIDTFSVSMIVTDAAGCKDSITINNLVLTTDPIPNFSVPQLSCPGADLHFNNQTIPGNYGSFWDFGDGNTTNVTSPNHSYALPGIYTVKLFVLDNNGCADSIIKVNHITVSEPLAAFTMSDTASSCLPFEVNFTNTSTFYVSSFWNFGPGEGSSTLNNPTHYFSSAGTFPVSLIITSEGGCKDTITHNVLVFDTTGSRVDYTPIGGCSPLLVDLSSFTNGPIATYFWDFGDGNTITTTSPNVSHIYTSYGNYLPKVIMEDPGGCLIPVQGPDTIFVIGAKAKFGLDRDVFCDFGTVNFIDSTTFNDPLTSYNWDFGDGGTSTDPNPSHYYAAPGLYTVQLIVNTQFGCRDTMTKTALVRVVARPDIDIAGDTVICVNSSLVHSGIFNVPDTSLVSWEWSFPNGNQSNQQNPPQQFYIVPGTFTVTSMAMNSTGCRDTTTQNILVHPLPVANIPPQLTIQSGFSVTIPAAYSANTISWSWSPPTGLSCTDCATPVAAPKFTTLYQVAFTDDNGCRNSSTVEIIVLCKNANVFMPNTFTPNSDGNNDVFYPRGRGLERVKMLRVFNRWGEVVFEKREFPVNDASAGWDGTYRGVKPKADVYVYQLEVFCENGEVIRLNGNVALVL